VDRLDSVLRRNAFDLVVVVAAAATALDVALRHDPAHLSGTTAWLAAPAAAALVLSLLGRRRWPFAAPAAAWVLGSAVSFVDGRLVPSSAGATGAGLVSAFVLGQITEPRVARAGLAVVLGGALTIVYNQPDHAAGDFLFVPIPFAIAWLAGFALRDRAERAAAAEERVAQVEREREAAARVAVAEERIRIARELHDIVAHSVSVMVLQVGAVRHNLPEALEPDREALHSVETTGRTALSEMRRLLGALRRSDEDVAMAPQPGLDSVEVLLDAVRRAGLPVQLRVDGSPPPLPRTLDLSAYRVVQEGLTNSLKHARATSADVALTYRPDELCVEVRDDGRGSAPTDGRGHGLLGIRERVSIYGGTMSAGAAPTGGFVLRASFPLDGGLR
jgi:signal transduction histidine kinase